MALAIPPAGGQELMRRTLSICLLAVLAVPGPLFAAPDVDDARGSNLSVTSAVLSIKGTSTMHDYTVSTKALKVVAAIATASDVKELLHPGALQDLQLEIPVNTFTSDKDGLTKQMSKALKADKHPVITFKLNGYTVESGAAGSTIKSTGTLTVAGVERPVEVVLDVKEQAGGALHLRGSRDLLMTEFGIKPPTMFMGMLKTNDKVTIDFELQLTLASRASN